MRLWADRSVPVNQVQNNARINLVTFAAGTDVVVAGKRIIAGLLLSMQRKPAIT